MPILGDNSPGKHTELHRRFENRTDEQSQRELLNREAALDAEYEAQLCENGEDNPDEIPTR